MRTSISERNLLFGILAVQMDFISRDALVEAMQAWLLNKSRPLDELLVEKGWLSEISSATHPSRFKDCKRHSLTHEDRLRSLPSESMRKWITFGAVVLLRQVFRSKYSRFAG